MRLDQRRKLKLKIYISQSYKIFCFLQIISRHFCSSFLLQLTSVSISLFLFIFFLFYEKSLNVFMIFLISVAMQFRVHSLLLHQAVWQILGRTEIYKENSHGPFARFGSTPSPFRQPDYASVYLIHREKKKKREVRQVGILAGGCFSWQSQF